MIRKYLNILAIAVIAMLVVPQYVAAEVNYTWDQTVNFTPATDGDETMNHLLEGQSSNYDTWDPVPSGSWFGGWTKESIVRLDHVPDDDFSVSYATVCKFGAESIMSGSAMTLVRLPVYTSDDPWSQAILNIYEIDVTTNWTFSKIVTENSNTPPDPHGLNDMRINFTDGPHHLIFFTEYFDPSDNSPTDEDDHFTRGNRTFCFVDAPIKPDTYYLFVSTFWYASDKYVEFYVEPDSLTGDWNRSTLAIHNEVAPDSYTIEIKNFNGSFGYSFDFRHGFGQSCYAANLYVTSGTKFVFYSYMNPTEIVDTNYLTFMLPYRSPTKNLTWDITIYGIDDEGSPSVTYTLYDVSDYVTNDFLLFSPDAQYKVNSTDAGYKLTGWHRIYLEIKNDTRIKLPLWDLENANDAGYNASWFTNQTDNNMNELNYVWDNEYNWNPLELLQVRLSANDRYQYHWHPQHALQLNDFYWQKSSPPTSKLEVSDAEEDMTFGEKILYAIGNVWLDGDGFYEPITWGLTLAQHISVFVAELIDKANVIVEYIGQTWDKLVGVFRDIGTWVWRIVDAVVGFLRLVVDIFTVILAVVLLIISVVAFFFPIFMTFRFAMVIRAALLGDLPGVQREIAQTTAAATAAVNTVKR